MDCGFTAHSKTIPSAPQATRVSSPPAVTGSYVAEDAAATTGSAGGAVASASGKARFSNGSGSANPPRARHKTPPTTIGMNAANPTIDPEMRLYQSGDRISDRLIRNASTV